MQHKLDLRGAIIPFSLLKVIQALKVMDPGETLEVFWSDPDTPTDLFKVLPDSTYEMISLDELAVHNYQLVGSDLNESQLLEVIKDKSTKIILGVIGGQGYIFGRGNQQISSKVIKKVRRENIIVLATVDKITTLKGAPLLVDTGDEEIDKHLSGYMQVISGLGERIVLKVEY